MVFKHIFIFIFTIAYCNTSENSPVVNTSYGNIQGFVGKSSKGLDFFTFHNIPFAKAPLGKLRFKDPQRPESWNGIRDGTKEHTSCSHPILLLYMKDQSNTYEGKEDCLYLSVYSPKFDGKLRPVMFFLHGGAFLGGSGIMYGGDYLMNEDVVLVSTNYRLGVLGFLSTEDDIMPGNLGLKDQTMALKWIQENISNFGGDPSRVTIFGESAGGASVHFHIMSPFSKGLFKRAILQSGTALCPWTHSKGLRGIAHQVGAAVGCFTPATTGRKQSQRLLECLQQVEEETLVMTYNNFMNWTFLPVNFNPYVDGIFLPDEPEVLLKEARYSKVDILIGVNKHEGAFLTNSLYSPNDFLEKLQQDFEYYGPVSLGLSYENDSEILSRKIYNHYLDKDTVGIEDVEKLTQMYGDRHFKVCTNIVAELHAENNNHENKVFLYQLEYRGEQSFSEIYGRDFATDWVAHADELFYLFPVKMFGSKTVQNKDDSTITDIMTKLWANFARNGNPTPDDSLLFKWDPFSKQYPNYLALNLHPEMTANDRTKICEFWSALTLEENKMLTRRNTGSKRENSEL